MNAWQRNFPLPLEAIIHDDCGIAARTEVVSGICNKVNELSEFVLGLDTRPILVPGAGNCDERMPLRFLRPCITALNNIIDHGNLDIEHVKQLGNNMDYHAFVPVCRNIGLTVNKIIGELRG